MLTVLILSVLFSGFYFIEATLNAMPAKRWAFIGVFLGPIAFPIFSISKHVAIRKATGFDNTFFSA
jgi:hypothetical protein